MLGIRLLCVGRLKERYYIEACREYEKRLGRYCSLTITELPESGDLRREGEALLGKLSAGGETMALCIEGDAWSSTDLAAYLRRCALDGRSHVNFVIGGSEGLSPAVKERAHRRISMSPMTFPHHLARVMLLEQIYRAFTINEGGKYHK